MNSISILNNSLSLHNSFSEAMDTEEFNVTEQSFDIPKPLLDMSSCSNANSLLLSNCKNVDQLVISSFKNCNVLEGQFEISKNVWNIIFNGTKLVSRYYPYYLKNRIQR